jgi:hypothetical protein
MDNPQCGGFRLVRQVSDMVGPECPAGSRFVEGHGCVPVPRAGSTLAGAWTGRGVETTGTSWGMNVTVNSFESGLCAQVTYPPDAKFPTQSCSADWYCRVSTDGGKLRAREIVTSGQGRCDSSGSVEMTLAADGKSADWRWSSPLRNAGASAHLLRAGAAP